MYEETKFILDGKTMRATKITLREWRKISKNINSYDITFVGKFKTIEGLRIKVFKDNKRDWYYYERR